MARFAGVYWFACEEVGLYCFSLWHPFVALDATGVSLGHAMVAPDLACPVVLAEHRHILPVAGRAVVLPYFNKSHFVSPYIWQS